MYNAFRFFESSSFLMWRRGYANPIVRFQFFMRQLIVYVFFLVLGLFIDTTQHVIIFMMHGMSRSSLSGSMHVEHWDDKTVFMLGQEGGTTIGRKI